MRTAILRLSVVLAAALPAAGCKETRVLGGYSRFELGEISDGIGGKMPADLVSFLQKEFPDEVRGAALPDSDGGKTLVVRGTIIYYESASTVGYVLGPMEEAICRTELVDKDTGQVLGVANCVGRTNAVNNSGVKSKASGLAKAFVKWIESGFPENMKTKTK